jgi:hypothetical protein
LKKNSPIKKFDPQKAKPQRINEEEEDEIKPSNPSLNKSPVVNNKAFIEASSQSSRRSSISSQHRKYSDEGDEEEPSLPAKKRTKRSNSTRCVGDKRENSKAANRGRRGLGAACAMPSFGRKLVLRFFNTP